MNEEGILEDRKAEQDNQMSKKYSVVSIFTGAGGMDIGFHGDFIFNNKYYEPLPFETKIAIDYSKDACNSVWHNKKYFPNTTPICSDITNTNPLWYKNGEVDVLTGGFPCVTFSMAGKRAGIKDDTNGKLYKAFANYIKCMKPKVFIGENVKGILSANKGQAVKTITKEFESMGYRVKIYSVNFADFGVSQLRERVLFVGIRNDIPQDFIPPEYTTMGKQNHIPVKDVIGNIPNDATNHNLMRIQDKTKKMLKAIPEGGNYLDLPEDLAVKGMMSNIYRKLDRNKPSITIIASGGGGTWGYHYEEPRHLTNRERARIQSFPDDFEFQGTNTEVRRQLGNAVPPVGIYHFAKCVANLLDGQHIIIGKNAINEFGK